MTEAGRRAITLGATLLLVALAATPGLAQWPCPTGEIHAAEVVRVALERPLGEYLERLRAELDEPVWIAYDVPLVGGVGRLCCHEGCDAGFDDKPCRLESRSRSFTMSDDDDRYRGGSEAVRILWRIAGGKVTEVRAYSCDCALDAGGRTVQLLDGVQPGESVSLLEAMILAEGGRANDPGDDALLALAVHAGTEADAAMVRLSRAGSPRKVREHVAFWLGSTRGRTGFARLREMLDEEADTEVLEQVVFGLSVSEVPQAADMLIALAREDSRRQVRSQALFWLALKAHREAEDALSQAVTDDPDADVREHAVFAVSQLPDDQAVPLLLKLARTNPHPEVRRAALFWLGQSDDPRALDLFEEILTD